MLKLYGQYRSRAFRVAWLCKESSIPFGGDRWDMADFTVASVCYSFIVMKYDLAGYANFRKWLMESIERPGAGAARQLRE